MAHKKKHIRKKDLNLRKTYIDSDGIEHNIIDPLKVRNLMHFDIQLNTRSNVVESKKYKQPKYKHKIFEEE